MLTREFLFQRRVIGCRLSVTQEEAKSQVKVCLLHGYYASDFAQEKSCLKGCFFHVFPSTSQKKLL